jgi:TRAP transporter TAXI family solute receptor
MGGGYQRYHGIGAFEGKPEPRLRVMYLFLANPVAFAVREDSGIKKLEDLEGKSFNPGGKGTATATLAKKVLDLAGIKPKYFEASYSDAISAIKDKRIVGMAKLTAGKSPDAVLMELMVATDIRILSWENSELDRIIEKVPYYGKTTIPAGVYESSWNKVEIPTWSQTMGCMTLKGLSEDIVYKMVKALCEDKTAQVSGFPPLKGTDFAKLTLEQASIPLHSGTVKYFKEIGMKIPSRLIPPEAK